MPDDLSQLLLRRISTSFSLIMIGILAFIVGAYTISQAQKLKELQKPMPFYASHFSTSTIPFDY
ncbi:MAG: hypothetical protein PHE77_00910 [Candidatus Pacebacteria bacterium]|nr:hypothetical protein [Candidatus Paceibacterota bacterium]